MKNKINLLKVYIIPSVIVLLSVGLFFVFKTDFFGVITLVCGTLSAYYMAIGKWYSYVFGLGHAVFYAYNGAINGLFGLVIFTVLFYVPLNIWGIINWFKNKQPDHVNMKEMTSKQTVLLCTTIVVSSVGLGFLLSLIPTQQLAFLDSTSQIINLCGVVLGTLRFRESWFVWLFNNSIDLAIWIINTVKQTENAEMMLVTVAALLILNIVGLVNWVKTLKKEKLAFQNIEQK